MIKELGYNTTYKTRLRTCKRCHKNYRTEAKYSEICKDCYSPIYRNPPISKNKYKAKYRIEKMLNKL